MLKINHASRKAGFKKSSNVNLKSLEEQEQGHETDFIVP